MAKSSLKFYNPVTPSLRGTVLLSRELSDVSPRKSLLKGLTSTGGRNNSGRTTMRFRGGAHKRKYRLISFKSDLLDLPGKVLSIEYDPNRTANIMLVQYQNNDVRYVIAPTGIKVGDNVVASRTITTVSVVPGVSLPLSEIPIGTDIHCVELIPGGGAKLARSAGSFVRLSGKESGDAILKMPSGETRRVSQLCMASIGIVSNDQLKNTKLGKAGRSRWKGFRPHVRGESMNPVDHPHGGRTRGGRHPVSPWGQCAKGLKTRRNKRTSCFIVSRRSKKI